MMGKRIDIGAFLQEQLRTRALDEVRAVEAARWLDEAHLLKRSGVSTAHGQFEVR